MFEDKTLVCKDCGKEFVWTAGAVSYTHLDVYKRQMFCSLSNRIARLLVVP